MDKLLLRKRAIVETIIDQLKNIFQIEHSRHRSPINFLVNLVSGPFAYCRQPRKPSLELVTCLLYLPNPNSRYKHQICLQRRKTSLNVPFSFIFDHLISILWYNLVIHTNIKLVQRKGVRCREGKLKAMISRLPESAI